MVQILMENKELILLLLIGGIWFELHCIGNAFSRLELHLKELALKQKGQ